MVLAVYNARTNPYEAMADSNYSTNVTLIDDNQNILGVSLNVTSGLYELRVKDADVLSALTTGSSTSKDLWQYYTSQGKGFSVQTAYITIAGQSETDFLLFRNPSGSGKIVQINDLDYTYNKGAGIAVVRVYIGPTVTATGTALTVRQKYVGHANTPVALVYQSPTTTAKGNLHRSFGQSSVGTYEEEEHLSFFLPANTDMLVTIQPAANNTDHAIFLDWGEV